ncbi:unnamed protein product [Gemmata massiliana]|uniref:Uncharacterized protein n=1 Tax=Gemmata massiliana TaxID=1210884 RepID=A0A6P2D1A0_9BACT|nr:hypothetical protein [Gemmata massiliana]VTR94135.1 unnamed protein product [Gemmata massiliana]
MSTGDDSRPPVAEVEKRVAELEAKLAKKKLPPELRKKLADSAKRLAALKAERDSWAKTALALELAEVKKKPEQKPEQ